MKFNVAVLTVVAASLFAAPIVASAADTSGASTTAPAPAKAKHHKHKKSGAASTPSTSAPAK